MPDLKRSKDFRYVFANAFGLQFGDNDATVRFGINEDVSKPNDPMLEEVAVVMTPRSLKILAHVLNRTITQFEETTGTTIPLPSEKLDEIEKSFQVGGNPKKPG